MVRISVAALLAFGTASLAVVADASRTESIQTPSPSESASPQKSSQAEPQASSENVDEINRIVDEAFKMTREFGAKKQELQHHGVQHPETAIEEMMVQMGHGTYSTRNETQPGEGDDVEKYMRGFASKRLSLTQALNTVTAKLSAQGVDTEKLLFDVWSQKMKSNSDADKTEASTATSSTTSGPISPDIPAA